MADLSNSIMADLSKKNIDKGIGVIIQFKADNSLE